MESRQMNKIIITILLVAFALPAIADSHDEIFDHYAYGDAKLSPDGSKIAFSIRAEGKMAIAFIARDSKKTLGSLTFPGINEVGSFQWVNNERVVINMVRKKPWREEPIFYGELYAVNYDGSRGEMIYGYSAGEKQLGTRFKKKESTYGWGELVDPLLTDDKHILISSTPMSTSGERKASLLKINAYTGIVRKKLATSPVAFAQFFLNKDGNVIAVSGVDDNNHTALYLKRTNEWLKVDKDIISTQASPITLNKSGSHLFVLDNISSTQKGLYKFNVSDLTYKHIYTDKKVDISRVETSINSNIPYALKLNDGYPAYIILNSKIEEGKAFKKIVKSFPYSSVSITSKSESGRFYVVLTTSDTNPGAIYLFDKEMNKLELLFKYKSNFKENDFTQMEPVVVKSADGHELPSYFTPAKNLKEGKVQPAVILVHGGPHFVRDYWQFSSSAQYLSHNGYSVLQVNYRGSGGYGDLHQRAGYKNWGTLIQDDIKAGYQWLVDNNKADANRVCIMGASFGGYSAIQSLIRHPETYQCAIANAGIYDLKLMFDEGDIQERKSGISYLKRVLGENEAQLKANSPVHHVSKIKAPILLAHGEKDERAPIEHAERLREALDEAGKNYEWYSLENEAHGFYNPENQKAYMKKVVKFLDQHLTH